jgi:hypothetical protein
LEGAHDVRRRQIAKENTQVDEVFMFHTSALILDLK